MNTQKAGANSLSVEAAKYSHTGRKRQNNEDWAEYYEPDNPAELAASGRLYVVADGVGGAADGQRASQYAVKKILYEYYESTEPDLGDRLRLAIKGANADIYGHTENSQSGNPMGTTVVAAVIRGRELIVANVGDSRAYYIHGNRTQQITRDHSLVQRLLDEGELTAEEAANFKRKNVILRSVGADEYVDVDIFRLEVAPGDVVLLCTDGLHKYFPNAAELAQVATTSDPDQAARRLVEQANARGGSDNISALVVRLSDPAAAAAVTQRVPRVSSPNWDDMPTARVTLRPNSSKRYLNRQQAKRKLFWIIGGIALFIILGAGMVVGGYELGNAIFSRQSKQQPPIATDTVTSQTPSVTVATNPLPSTIAPSDTDAFIVVSIAGTATALAQEAELSPTVRARGTVASTMGASLSDETQAPEINPASAPECRWYVRTGETLDFMLVEAGWDPSSKDAFENRVVAENQLKGKDNVQAGQTIIVPWSKPLARVNGSQLPFCPNHETPTVTPGPTEAPNQTVTPSPIGTQ